MRKSTHVCWLLLGLACGAAGCSQSGTAAELGTVQGQVLVDGQPGADLEIVFEPQAKGTKKADLQVGTTSTARTDSNGTYKLKYQGGKLSGAVVGPHLVRISNTAGGGPAGGETGAVATTPIPEKYNRESSETREVKPGENKFDFEIQTAP